MFIGSFELFALNFYLENFSSSGREFGISAITGSLGIKTFTQEKKLQNRPNYLMLESGSSD